MSQTRTYNKTTDRSSDRNHARYEQEYVYGNAVRRAEPAPREEVRRRKQQPNPGHMKKHRQQQRVAKKNQQKALAMNMGYVLFLAVATILCAVVCFVYIYRQSTLSAAMKQVAVLEGQIEELQTSNNLLENQIESGMKIDEIRRRAMAYGMKYPDEDQIIYFSVDGSDYMDQYNEVPAR